MRIVVSFFTKVMSEKEYVDLMTPPPLKTFFFSKILKVVLTALYQKWMNVHDCSSMCTGRSIYVQINHHKIIA